MRDMFYKKKFNNWKLSSMASREDDSLPVIVSSGGSITMYM